jgi:hypothetical protein
MRKGQKKRGKRSKYERQKQGRGRMMCNKSKLINRKILSA